MSYVSMVDRAIEIVFMVNPTSMEIEKLNNLFDTAASHHEFKIEEATFRYMDDLDSKSGALLTHVSMLIAAVSIMITVFDDSIGRGFLLIEAAIYVSIATGLLRCVNIIRPISIDHQAYSQEILREAAIRLEVYTKARVLSILATIAFLVGIIVKLFTFY